MAIPETEVSAMEKILKNPGLEHLAENIFGNLSCEDVEVCRGINQSSREILDNPMFWLRQFGSLSKKNQKDWFKVIQSAKNSDKEKVILRYLQWNLKKEAVDLPCYTSPAVQDDFRKKIWESCGKWDSSEKGFSSFLAKYLPFLKIFHSEEHRRHENIEIVKILAPLTDNPNGPNKYGETPIHEAAFNGHKEIIKILETYNNF